MSVYNITQILYHLFTSNTNYKIMSFNIQTVLFCAVKFVQTAAICCKKFPSFFILSITHAPLFLPCPFFLFSCSSFLFVPTEGQIRERWRESERIQKGGCYAQDAWLSRELRAKKKKKREIKEKRNEIRLDWGTKW